MLYLIGLGLGTEKDLTLRGLEYIEASDIIYLECFTSLSNVNLQNITKKKITLADRKLVEENTKDILESARTKTVSFLVIGDPCCATTHMDLVLRATKAGIRTEIIHNASIISAVPEVGLMAYKFGETVSIPYFSDNWRPYSVIDKILKNFKNNLHTLCLLDIQLKEQSFANMMRGNQIFEAPRVMTVNEGINQIFSLVPEKRLRTEDFCDSEYWKTVENIPNLKAFGVARMGWSDSLIKSGALKDLLVQEFGRAPHSLIICAREMHELEEEFYRLYLTNE